MAPSGEASAFARMLTSRFCDCVSVALKPTLSSACVTAARSIASRITAWPILNGLDEKREAPIRITTLCMSSMPAEEEATEE